MMSDPLKVLSIGAGAIGTYIGGSLVLQGHKVVFVERPSVAERLKSQGLKLGLGGETQHISQPIITSSIIEALEMEDFDVALYALKSYDTESFVNMLSTLKGSLPPFLCLSNGIENELSLERVLGADRVILGTVTSAVGRRDAGDITLERLRGMGVADGHPLSPGLVNALDGAGLNAWLFSNGDEMKWSKMLTNLISNATSAILSLPPAEVFAHSGLFKLENMQLRETLMVMRAQDLKTVDLPGTPVRLLSFAVRFLPLSISRPLLSKAVGGGRGDKMPSFYIDLQSGRGKSEVDYLNGAVVRKGEKYNIPTPANKFLNKTLMGLTTGSVRKDTYIKQPGKLLSDFRVFEAEIA
jgi:2-dehydropantoate 2-reductase